MGGDAWRTALCMKLKLSTRVWENTAIYGDLIDMLLNKKQDIKCKYGMSAVGDRNHSVCKALLEGAFNHAKSKADSLYYAAVEQKIRGKMQYSPDQQEIDKYKPIVYQLIKDNPGLMQSDIKKHFPPDMENIVGLAHWANFQEGRVRREKKSRSFQLWVDE